MTKPLRRKDRRLDDTEARTLLNHAEYGILSTADADHRPYGIPVNFAIMEKKIYFHCAPEGRKLDNIGANPKVSFCVVGRTELMPAKFATRYESVVVDGSARRVADPAEKRNALRALVAKYSPEHIAAGEAYIDKLIDKTAVIEISIIHLAGKARR